MLDVIKIILVRHGEKTGLSSDKADPLSAAGEAQVRELYRRLQKATRRPTLFLTSRFRHAQQTAEILRCALNRRAPLIRLDSLTPLPVRLASKAVNDERYVTAILDEVRKLAAVRPGMKLGDNSTIVMVLHEPRNIQVALQLQGESPRGWTTWRGGAWSGKWPKYGEAVFLKARGSDEVKAGQAVEIVRRARGTVAPATKSS
jgi:phosphohistidine phosphatase SixA